MSHNPAHYRYISLKLANVLEDIGVNERVVKLRRRSLLLCEALDGVTLRLLGRIESNYIFGSQSEGTTTPGLKSDFDFLVSKNTFVIIQDVTEYEPGLCNLVMDRECTAPGYCILIVVATGGELKNTSFLGDHNNGPATILRCDFMHIESVTAIPCKTLPRFLNCWLTRQLQKGRLTKDMVSYIESHPCYVVPVGSKNSPLKDKEWRISTCHAERCLMFNMNITQIQCYVMFKLMLKSYLQHPTEKALSSFMCKNILLLCIEDTDPEDWCPKNLLFLFQFCLLQLKHCVSEEYCPHFIIHENNLMARRFSTKVKNWLLDKIQKLFQDSVSHFLTLKIDKIGSRLQIKLKITKRINLYVVKPRTMARDISGVKFYDLATRVSGVFSRLLRPIASGQATFNSNIDKIIQFYNQGSNQEQTAIRLLAPLLYSSLGSVMASRDIQHGHPVSDKAMVYLHLGQDSDVTSGRLKLASVYYCTGDYSKAKVILKTIEDKYDPSLVAAVCSCIDNDRFMASKRFGNYTYGRDERAFRHAVAYGVRFLPSEIHCQPKELQYEMFRSTKEDLKLHRSKLDWDDWMDWAVVDSLPYLYFLQYKTYGRLQQRYDQQQALDKLIYSIITTANLEHMETAFNLLGQCMEQENDYEFAFLAYVKSLKTRARNNAANVHICRLLNSFISSM